MVTILGRMDGLVAAATELIAVRSTADRPGELHRALDMVLGVVGPGFTVTRFASNGKPSALVFRPGTSGAFRGILNAPPDVGRGTREQFRARHDGDRLYGRGAQ